MLPDLDKPLPAVSCPVPVNCVKAIDVVSTTIVPLVEHTKPWSEFIVPSSTKKKAPTNSSVPSISEARAIVASSAVHT